MQQQRERIEELEAALVQRPQRRQRHLGRLSLVLLTILSALAVTSNAFASIPDTNGLVTFCYVANANDTRIIDTANSTCKSYEHSIALLTQSSSIDAGHITGVLPIANGGTGSSTQNFVDLSTNQTISGTKTFSNTIGGNVSGNAAGFSGNLSGDVTGTQSSTKVTGIESQGIMGAGTAAGQYLRFDGTHWTPSAIQAGDIPDLSSSYVSLSGDQTVGGTKTFTNGITFSDGTVQATAASNQGMEAFATNGIWTAPANVTQVVVQAWGGGGGGADGCISSGGDSPFQGGGGGGAGAYIEQVVSVTPGHAYVVTVGSAGQGGQSYVGFSGAQNGGNGGSTTLADGGSPLVSAGGGSGATTSDNCGNATSSGGDGGTATASGVTLADVAGGSGSAGGGPTSVLSDAEGGAGGTQGSTHGIATGGAGAAAGGSGATWSPGSSGSPGYMIISW